MCGFVGLVRAPLLVSFALSVQLDANLADQRPAYGKFQPAELPQPDGYSLRPDADCGSRTLSASTGRPSHGFAARVEACRLRCDLQESCKCFQVKLDSGACRVSHEAGAVRVRQRAGSVAYLRRPKASCPPAVRGPAAVPAGCSGTFGYLEPGPEEDAAAPPKLCTHFVRCQPAPASGAPGADVPEISGTRNATSSSDRCSEVQCPAGLSYSVEMKRCTWPSRISSRCTSIIPVGQKLHASTCSAALLIASDTGDATQTFIKDEMNAWRLESGRAGQKHASQKAAFRMLNMIQIETHDSFRVASFSPSKTDLGSPEAMQALGLVNIEVSPDDDYVKLEIMGIASRWSLLREGGGASVKGAAKHLAGSLLQALTERYPRRSIILAGTPADNVVKKMYEDNGMKKVGESEAGMPKMELNIPAKCVPFMIRVALCQAPSVTDTLSIVESLAMRELRHLVRINGCADLLPRNLFLQAIKKKTAALKKKTKFIPTFFNTRLIVGSDGEARTQKRTQTSTREDPAPVDRTDEQDDAVVIKMMKTVSKTLDDS